MASSTSRTYQSISLGRHVEQRFCAKRAYPSGAPLVITGSEASFAIDASIGVTPLHHDGFLLSHFHEDHVVGVAASSLPVLVHELDRPAVQSWAGFCEWSGYPEPQWPTTVQETFRWEPVPAASDLYEGRGIDLGGVTVTPLHLPGHTPGHCGFLIEPDGVLYLGDIDLSRFGPYYGDAKASLRETIRSMDRVREIDARVYSTFHQHGHVFGRPAFLDLLERHRAVIDVRDQRIAQLMSAGYDDAVAMTGRGVVYRVGSRPLWGLAGETRMIQRHLDAMHHTPTATPIAADSKGLT